MASETLTIDPTASPVELALGTSGFQLVSFDSPPPTRKRVEATSQDTEGSIQVASQYDNRTVTIVVRTLPATTRSLWYARLAQLSKKVGKINREGGVIKRIGIGSAVNHYYDLVDGAGMITWDNVRYALRMDMDVTLTFLARPFAREDEIALSVHSETTLPCLTFVETGIKGDVPATGRLVVTGVQAAPADQQWLVWGQQSKYYNPAATAALFNEAENLTPLDASVKATVTGGSGATLNAMKHPGLPISQWCPVLSTDTVASGKMTHKGTYNVWIRVQSSGYPSLRLVYGLGDYTSLVTNPEEKGQYTPNNWEFRSLGIVRLGESSQWSGVLQAKASAQGETLSVDYLLLVPLDEGSGKAQSVQKDSPLGINDSRYPGTCVNDALTGTRAWSSPSSAGIPDGQMAQSLYGPGSTNYLRATNCQFAIPASAVISGIYLDVLCSGMLGPIYDNDVHLVKAAGAVVGTNYASIQGWPNQYPAWRGYGGSSDLWGTTWTPAEVNAATFGAAISANLNSGGWALIDSIAIYVYYTLSGGFAQTPDAVIFASRTMQIASNGVTRQNASGSFWVPENAYQGDNLLVMPAGVEGRSNRFVIKTSRAQTSNNWADSNIDDISAQLFYTPRWLMHPDS